MPTSGPQHAGPRTPGAAASPTAKTLIEGCTILDPEARRGYREGVSILIDGQRIAEVSSAPIDTASHRRIDGTGLLAIPGLINAHTHSPENVAKATNDRLTFEPWLIHSIWALRDLGPRDYFLSAMLGCIEMLRSGTTSVLDHVGLGSGDNQANLDGVMQAYRLSGMRAGVAPLFRETGHDIADGDARGFALSEIAPAAAAPPAGDELVRLIERFFARWHEAEHGRLRCWVGPSGVQWFTPDLLHRYFDLARHLGGGVHMHLMETRVQDQIVRRLHGKTAVALLDDEGLLSPDLSLPHSVWITDRDIDRLAQAGAVPIHNPAANLRLGSGLAPVAKMLRAGIVPALGADGAKSSDHQNMFGHIHLAALIHNLTDGRPDHWIASRSVLQMAWQGGAAAMRRAGELGRIAPGWLADITLLDLSAPGLVPLNDAFHHLAYCELGQSVHSVIIDGQLVMQAGRILSFDADAIVAEAREAFRERAFHHPPAPEWQRAIDRHLAYQQQVLRTTSFEQD